MMRPRTPTRPAWTRALLCLALAFCVGSDASAQISLASAVNLALGSNPRVKAAQDEVAKALAQLSEAHDIYVPSLNAGAGIGQAYGYSPYPPTLFTLSSGSLVYNPGQIHYTRSARAGLDAARLALEDAREAVAEDTALAVIALDHDQQRERVIQQQSGDAATLLQIVQQRLDAGQDTQIGLTQAKLTASQFRLALLRAQDDTTVDREHLARLIDLPATALTVSSDFPAAPVLDSTSTPTGDYANASVASAFAGAKARQQQAEGDARFRFRPQFNLVAQYNRYATFTNSFKQLQILEPNLTANEAVFGIQIAIPMLDRYRTAKARESAADAAKAFHDAQSAQIQALDAEGRIRRSLAELQVQSEIAGFQQQLAQQQLEVLQTQLQSGNPDGQQMTPKDEQNARIAERDKYLGVLDAAYNLHQAEIQLLRQTGALEQWLRSSVTPTP